LNIEQHRRVVSERILAIKISPKVVPTHHLEREPRTQCNKGSKMGVSHLLSWRELGIQGGHRSKNTQDRCLEKRLLLRQRIPEFCKGIALKP
jgi:hypothetical protein